MSNNELNPAQALEITPPAAPHNAHTMLDTIETALTDEVAHEAALRDSALRVPR